MEIVFKKGNTKNTITCRRSDGSATWQESDAFLINHDLAHYAVEKTFGLSQGFYGLVQSGLDITDFEKKQKISPSQIPKEGFKAEILVQLFSIERSGINNHIKDFNESYHEQAVKWKLDVERFPESLLSETRRLLSEVIDDWHHLSVNESMTLSWPDTNPKKW